MKIADVYRKGLTLRVREQEGEFIQTVKTEDPAEGDMLERQEWEDPIQSKRPVLDAPRTGRRLPDAVRDDWLRPVFTTMITRTAISIRPHPSVWIEAAIDEGEIRASDIGAVEPVSEIEIELKKGDPGVLFDMGLKLLQAAPIRIEIRSKAERGYRLLGAGGLMPPVVRVGPVKLDPAMSVEAALERIGRRCLTHLLRNELAALAGEPEGIHQMRIAIRRLRSALSALKRALPMKHYHWASEELTWLAHVLGSARNWDTFTACLLPPVASALPARPEFEYVVDAAERRRRGAHEEAKQTIVSKRYTKAMLQLLRWFVARAWRDQQLSKQAAFLLDRIVNVAPDLLEQHHRKARKRSKGFEALTATQRHKLRIALKKLQYTIEFLASLFDEDQVRPFVKRVKRLQNDLGYANDVRVGYDLMDQVGETNNHARAINRAGGIVLGWHQRILVDRDTKVRKHVRRFRRLDPFW